MPDMRDFPIKLNEDILPMHNGWKEKYGTDEEVNTTEAGTDKASVTRKGKLTLSLSYTLPGTFAEIFEKYALDDEDVESDRIAVSLYSPKDGEYKTRTMRMRDYGKDKVERSEEMDGSTKGMFVYSFTLIEY